MRFYILLLLVAIDIIAAQDQTTTSTVITTPTSTATATTTLTQTTSSSSRASTAISTASSTATSTASSTATTRASTASSTSRASTASSTSRASTASSTSRASTASSTARASTASSTARASTASSTARASTASSTSRASTASTASRASTASSASTASRASTASSRVSTASSQASTVSSTVVSTTQKPSVQQNFTCKEGNTTKFGLTGSFTLFITYNKTKEGLTTVPIEVPQTRNFSGTCGNSSIESLTFDFFNGWNITYTFQADASSESDLLSAVNDYYISNITVVYFHDEHLPNSTTPQARGVSNFAQQGYLEGTSDGYYTCQNNVSLKINDDVTLTTVDFKYKAFNNQGDINFDGGKVTECKTDEETSSVVPIAVGAALAGLVIIVLIAYLIGRKRSRKTGYETV